MLLYTVIDDSDGHVFLETEDIEDAYDCATYWHRHAGGPVRILVEELVEW